MKFINKLESFLKEVGLKKSVFTHWLIKQAKLNCGINDIKNIAVEDSDEVSFDVSKLLESDLKKLLLFFKIPAETLPISHKIMVKDQFLCDVVLPQFKKYAIEYDRNWLEEKEIGHKILEIEEDELDDFVLVDYHDDDTTFENYPWLDPAHPLYFPSSQPNPSSKLTRWDAMEKFSVKNWYPHLKKYTFESCFVALNHDDILFLAGTSSPTYDRTKLENVFNTIISEFSNHEAFMRLSTRSPKDSKYLFDETSTIMANDFTYWNETENKNQQMVSFVSAMTKAMKVADGKKIINMILESPRVHGDLLSLLNMPSPAEHATEVVMRKWYEIRPDHEFRVFVSRRGRKESIITAISQYFHFLYFDKIPEDCFNFQDDKIKDKLVSQFQNYVLKLIDPAVARVLNFSSEDGEDNQTDSIREYIVDLALIPLEQYEGELTDDNQITIIGKNYVIMVIELNPFAPSATGCGLYNWQKDLNMLWGKEDSDYPQFRYRKTPREKHHSVTLLPPDYEFTIQNALSKRLSNLNPFDDNQDGSQVPVSRSLDSLGIGFFEPSQSTFTSSLDDFSIDTSRLSC